jgi:hypothetical protein
MEEVGAGERYADAGTAEVLERVAIQPLGGRVSDGAFGDAGR